MTESKVNLYRSGWMAGLRDARQIVEGARHESQDLETWDTLTEVARALQNLIEVLAEIRRRDDDQES